MRRSVATVSMSGTLRGKLEAIAAARFDGYELFENDLLYYRGRPEEAARIAGDLGLTCELYQPFRDFEGAPDELLARNLDRAERKFDVMEALGCSMMLVCSNTSAQAQPEAERAADQLRRLAERAARRNLRIGYEALAWGRHVNRYAQAWSIVERVDHPHLGLILDSFHTFSLRDDPAGIKGIPGEKIFFLQLADAPLLSMDVLQWARHFRNFPGQGQFDLETFLANTLLAGYIGPISLEVFNDLFREAPARQTAQDAMRSLLYLEGQVRARFERTAPPAAQTEGVLDRIELYSPPAMPSFHGISFIEFAVDAAAAQALGAVLETLGFHRAGSHRSKDVLLYRQGDIALILNADAHSLARALFNEHGPSVCAIGLRTDQPVRALNRAVALHCSRYSSPLGRAESEIPAVRAPDGSVFYFVDEALGSDGLFEIDFRLQPAAAAPTAGLRRVDHIAFGLAQDQLDTWMLFCRAVFGMQPGDSLELSDPFGLVRSCGLASGDRCLRFVLNVSAGSRTGTARTVQASGGSGVHHVAFACDDIVPLLRRLRERGVEFVAISPNYYDDLQARLDIGDGRRLELEAVDGLYDRGGAGDYVHAYTRRFGDRFFFEIVERGAGYDGYGASNAPARMASQSSDT